MSAELMKTKFVRRPLSFRRPSVRVAIISEPKARIYFNVCLLVPLGHTPGLFFFEFKKKNDGDFLRMFFVFVNMGPYESENFKHATPTNRSR